MAGELVETSRLWARQNAAIKPEWAEQLGAHLVKRTYSEPHWSKKRASVMAYERVTLYGVPLVSDRMVSYGKVDVALSRELFIRHALVYGEWSSRHRFLQTNRRLLEEAEELEHRARRRDIVVDEHTLFDFYDERVGAEVVSGAHFDQWWKQERRTRPELLTFDPSMLTRDTAGQVTEADYPETWDSDEEGLTFPISYHFDPGAADDGLTIDVPVATLNRVEADDFSWQVPGLREELVTSLIRSLPKNLRVSFVPAPNTAREFLAAVPPGEEPLLTALERWMRATTGVVVPREAWDWSKVAPHLLPTYRVVDDGGTEQARGKDLEALKAPLRPQFEQAMEEVASDSGLARTGETSWTFGTIEESSTLTRAGHRVTVFPALVDEGTTVGLGVFGSTDEAEARHRLGVRRLVLLGLPLPSDSSLLDPLSTAQRLGLAGSPYSSVSELLVDSRAAVVGGLVDGGPHVRTEADFAALVERARASAEPALRDLLGEVQRVLDGWRTVDKLLSGRADMALLPALADLKAQLERLVHPGFLSEAGPEQLRRYPTYLRAITLRREALGQGGAAVNRDRQLMDRIAELQESYLHQVAALPDGRPPGERLRKARWMLEELRVSLWAQQLGTAYPVSDQRVRAALAAS
jgi:ATP-dependent helicase HrpA